MARSVLRHASHLFTHEDTMKTLTLHGRDLDGKELGQLLEEFANGASQDQRAAFIDQITHGTHRTLQQKIMGMVVGLLEAWAEDAKPGRCDARNEATVKLAAEMIAATPDRCLPFI